MMFYDLETTSLEPFSKHARVTMIGVMTDKGEITMFHNQDEAVMLKEFWDFVLGKPNSTWVGFNNISFDSKFLMKRSIVKGVMPHPGFMSRQLDLRMLIDKDKFAKGKLTEIVQAINGERKLNDWDAKDAVILFYQGKLKELEDYCVQDLRLTKMLYDQLVKVGLIQ